MISVKGRVKKMMMNIAALMNLISTEEKNLDNRIKMINGLSINTSTMELDGRVNIIEDNKEEFALAMKELEEGISYLTKLKTILYEKNNSFKLTDGRTIQEAIVDNTNLRKLKNVYETLLLSKNSKRRVTEVNNSYFECRTINFDLNDIREKLVTLDKKIQETDFEISKLNSLEFEIQKCGSTKLVCRLNKI